MPSVRSELPRMKVWLTRDPKVTVVDGVRPRCEQIRSKLKVYVPGARDIIALLICPARGCHPSSSPTQEAAKPAEERSANHVYGSASDCEERPDVGGVQSWGDGTEVLAAAVGFTIGRSHQQQNDNSNKQNTRCHTNHGHNPLELSCGSRMKQAP